MQFSSGQLSIICMAIKKDEIEILFKENYARMHRLAAMLLHDTEAAHDIVHDVFAAILDSQSFIAYDITYLLTSIRNKCLNRLKAIDVRNRFRELYLIENSDTEPIHDWPDEETLALIEECERQMPPKCAEVFQLRFHDGKSAKEISNALNIGERVVYKHLRHALTILKHQLNGQT